MLKEVIKSALNVLEHDIYVDIFDVTFSFSFVCTESDSLKCNDASFYSFLCLLLNIACFVSFEAFTAVVFQVEVFWVVTQCGVVVRNQRFGGSRFLHLQGEDLELHGLTSSEPPSQCCGIGPHLAQYC
jgi:hypothetical protein